MRKLHGFAIAMLGVLVVLSSAAFAAGGCCSGGVCTLGDATTDNTLTDQEKADGWKLLFDGKTLEGWGITGKVAKGWQIEQGTIFCDGKLGNYCYTKDRFENYEVKVDFMVDKYTNSGIFFRWDNLKDPVDTGIEMQVLDSADVKWPTKWDCGAIYDVLEPTANAMKPALEWNTAIIKCRDNFVTVTLNDKCVVRMDLDRFRVAHKNLDGTRNKFKLAYRDMARVGHIGMQSHGGKVWYKNIKIKTLQPTAQPSS